ncbi:lipoprotein [Mycoplasma mycoides]|uniref:Lipoprotein n=1 Tax=Mycoplasma mycoides subsp. capri TaxID=40477 RepID=A0AB38GF06_MYCMC|nr:lipoprotein [Mycoplasma mycoides]ADH21688.1 lipoprotein, putative (VlcF) [synthetic Mycoplasma mycoides JCVI-syn1.0]ACU78364.1 lipoprotein, putative (VlcF) [Mycoplasma mycoides subsp. capri str. GM12]ACU79193.1 lipoprotein, putative (VlcF) [Mycoplasma mycoides subsp. capri str. GM12]SRX59387.1 lipoprotein [Mycoplasma mycoides subsp. capri]SRX64668.1 lipoprotein [Mycoplasma mycoides subsp. capri]
MKKLITILGSVGLVATTSAAVIACGDRAPSTKSAEKVENKEKTKPSEAPKKEESKKEEKKQEEFQPKFSDVENKNLGNFEPSNKNTISQLDIKKELAKKLNVNESDLQELKINYDEKTGKVTLPRFNNKNLKFNFTTFYQLGKIKTNKTGDIWFLSQLDIKKELAKKLNVNESDLQELKTDSSSNGIGFGSVRSKTFVGTLEFKFEIDENK